MVSELVRNGNVFQQRGVNSTATSDRNLYLQGYIYIYINRQIIRKKLLLLIIKLPTFENWVLSFRHVFQSFCTIS